MNKTFQDIRPVKLVAAITSQNEVNRLVNVWTPVLRDVMRPFVGKKIFNADGSKTKKVTEALNGILPDVTPGFRYSLYSGGALGYHFYVSTFYAYPGETHGSSIQKSAFLYIGEIEFNSNVLKEISSLESNLKTDWTAEEILNLRNELSAAKDAVNKIQSKLHLFGEYDN
jgi:hypothetical protein